MIMRNVFLILIGCLLSFVGSAQADLTLETCKQQARDNYPKLHQSKLFEEISRLKNENNSINFLPSLELKGQATYQSEVIELDIPIPGFDFEPVSKDQYKIYLDVKQTIWDGGITKASKELELKNLELNLQQLEVEINQVYSMVEGYFFSILMLDKSIEVLNVQGEVLQVQKDKIAVALEHGAARKKDLLKLEVEQLNLVQKVVELESQKSSLVSVLSLLIGEEIGAAKFSMPQVNGLFENEMLSPEFDYFNLQKQKLNKYDEMLSVARNPKFFGFGQAGYGKPGFNMLKNEFDPYYIVGVGASWKITDWKLTKRNKQINAQQREIINTLQNDFVLKQNMKLMEQSKKVSSLKEIISVDEKLLEGRSTIVDIAKSELQNGSITSSDFLMDLNAETVAKINKEIHAIQLVQAKSQYNTILGYK